MKKFKVAVTGCFVENHSDFVRALSPRIEVVPNGSVDLSGTLL